MSAATTSGRGHEFVRIFPEMRDASWRNRTDELFALGTEMTSSHEKAEIESEVEAGWSHLAQFLAHDITGDFGRARIGTVAGMSAPVNVLTRDLDLDSVFGKGPEIEPFYYDNNKRLLIGTPHVDMPRNSLGRCIIPEKRNDENIFNLSIHVRFAEYYNHLINSGVGWQDAMRIVRWTWQYIVLNDYLPMVAYEAAEIQAVHDTTMTEFVDFNWRTTGMPLEFAGAVFRYGHTTTRSESRINDDVEAKGIFALQPFQPKTAKVDWKYQFDFANSQTWSGDKMLQINPHLHPVLAALPNDFATIAGIKSNNLAVRNLLRSCVEYELPSGFAFARRMGVDPVGTDGPLWWYILQEGLIATEGERLGPCGSTILVETIVSLVKSDPNSYLVQDRSFQPLNGLAEILTGNLR